MRGRADVEAVSDPSAAIVVCTYGLLTKDAPAAAALGGRGFGVVVVDESHALKTRGSQRGLALAPVLAAAARLVLLSGTPALNRPAELYPQLAPLAPQLVGGWSAFAARYCGARRGRFGWEANGATHLDELRERLLAPLMIRRKKADVLTELPRKRRCRRRAARAGSARALIKNELILIDFGNPFSPSRPALPLASCLSPWPAVRPPPQAARRPRE